MTGQYIVQGIFALAGIVSLLASLLNWDWFFTTRNAQTIVRNVGRNRARLFYGILGIIIIGMAVFFFVETSGIHLIGYSKISLSYLKEDDNVQKNGTSMVSPIIINMTNSRECCIRTFLLYDFVSKHFQPHL